MARKAKELSALEVGRLTIPGYHFVGGVAGLILQVTESKARSWILRATVGGKRRDIGLGGFPDVTLAGAREAARISRDKIKAGTDQLKNGQQHVALSPPPEHRQSLLARLPPNISKPTRPAGRTASTQPSGQRRLKATHIRPSESCASQMLKRNTSSPS